MGMSPSWRRPMRSESMSMLITWCPRSAREAAVTNPTYPAPTAVTRSAVVPFGFAMNPSILLQEALGPAGQAFRYLVPVGCIGQAPVLLRVGHEPSLRVQNVYSAGAAVVGAVRVDTDVEVGSRLVGHAGAVYVGEVYILRGAGHDHADTPGPQLFAQEKGDGQH